MPFSVTNIDQNHRIIKLFRLEKTHQIQPLT